MIRGKSFFGEFSVLAVFFIVSFLGVAYGGIMLGGAMLRSTTNDSVSEESVANADDGASVNAALANGRVLGESEAVEAGEVAPTAESYREALQHAIAPVFVSIKMGEPADLLKDPEFVSRISSVLDAVMKLSVPRQEMQTQLATAMFLGKWKNAALSKQGVAELSSATKIFLETHSWIRVE
jgi:hypothetical protein